jgi:Alcohol dehydrogenase GroES-like domain
MYGVGDVRVESVPDSRIVEPTEALLRVTRACICGSDLWPYSQMERDDAGRRMGHEFIGVVEALGADVRATKTGDLVVAPFAWSDGTCVFCRWGPSSRGTCGTRGPGQNDRDRRRRRGRALQRDRREEAGCGAGHPARAPSRPDRTREGVRCDGDRQRSGEEAVERVRQLTGGIGAHFVLE